jgi:ppGpp synthetase/RelA/SpoT-type nucleotidyltranferase/Tfp pilus assembly protein PilF
MNDIASIYATQRHRYEAFAHEVERIVTQSLKAKDVKPQAINSRAKDVTSFEEKATKRDAEGKLKYTDPMKEVTDLAGVRIITFTLDDVVKVCEFVRESFGVIEQKDIGEERIRDGKYGYQSIHFLCELTEQRLSLPEFQQFKGMICEIQVRTMLQHVWAQLEHRMRYKGTSALPALIDRKFTALAGLLEIGDREFQSIESDYDRLRNTVKEEVTAELTREAFDQPSEDGAKVQSGGDESRTQRLLVRDLIAEGKTLEAIESFNQKIVDQPNAVTLYLGRARAKFLNGDVAGAISDLEQAEKVHPGYPATAVLRAKIVEGRVDPSPSNETLEKANALTNDGHGAMRAGNGEAAYMKYTEAGEYGASRPFTTLNRAMACVLAEDYAGAGELLSSFQIRHGTPMEINILALTIINDALRSSALNEAGIDSLRSIFYAKGDYRFSLSPLVHLRQGMLKKYHGAHTLFIAERVFNAISDEPPF